MDSKLVHLAQTLGAKLITNDFNLGEVAKLHNVPLRELESAGGAMKPAVLPGEVLSLRVVREGKEKGQGVAYMPDGTMVVINHAQHPARPAGAGASPEPGANRRRRHHLCRLENRGA